MRNSVKRWLLHYYIALQLGAGAVTHLGVLSLDDGPPPIVRPYRDLLAGPWDPREVVTTRHGPAIVTTRNHDYPQPYTATRWLN